METVREIIAAMQEAAPKGREHLDEPTLDRLRALTQSLLAASADADREYQRFLGIQHRSLGLPGEDMHDWLGGKIVLVTGGTGCVGSMLMRQLVSCRPRRLICLSRGHRRLALPGRVRVRPGGRPGRPRGEVRGRRDQAGRAVPRGGPA